MDAGQIIKKNITGKKYNKLTVLEDYRFRDKYKNLYVLCKCDCGTIVEARKGSVLNGAKSSCGCAYSESARKRGLAHRKAPGEGGLHKIIRKIQERAKRKGMAYELSNDFVRIITKQNCFYCGIGPSQKSYSASKKKLEESRNHTMYLYNGIDRIDNQKGYTEDNVQTCCRDCNMLRGNQLTVEETLTIVHWLQEMRKTTDIWAELRTERELQRLNNG